MLVQLHNHNRGHERTYTHKKQGTLRIVEHHCCKCN